MVVFGCATEMGVYYGISLNGMVVRKEVDIGKITTE